ncbi:dienelactone hydrolase family protein [Pedobacter sp. MC2016-14]|uniref:alpha/beta hydrolase family protein n=1 Tax=Pedobacter sp. MC2016-14 TaxID=2897327 RepID=UPI001E37317F|nr:dienelactone hydrolase family protein [Pedobacter sp. MC2016-14]MCD0488968.1 dienelactone hydrolase family protein [Pedobacter sp. MC2016-14]
MKYAFLMVCNLTIITVANAQDPLIPYLTGKAPRIVKELGDSVAGTVSVKKVVYYSRDGKTADGKVVPSEIYAVIVRPVKSGNYPGLLILHGGKGYAELQKAIAWAKRGYVTVAIDLPGIADPLQVPNSSGAWKAFPYNSHRFNALPDITYSTIFDGVVAGLQGFYLLQAQPGVIKDKLGISGISWGGYTTTMLTALLKNKVQAAFSVYGSGFYDEGSAFAGQLTLVTPGEREEWLKQLDAGRRVKDIQSPYFIAAASNDIFFYPPAITATLKAVKSKTGHLFAPNANHSAPVPGGTAEPGRAGWLKMEEPYFDYYLKGEGSPLPEIYGQQSSIVNEDVKVRFQVKNAVKPALASVFYCIDQENWTKHKWLKADAQLLENGWYEAVLPGAAAQGYWYVSVSDSRPVTTSTYMYPSNKPLNN